MPMGQLVTISYWSTDPIQPGTYKITATDPAGNESSVEEELVVNPIVPVDLPSITPSNMDEFISATVDNVYVNGLLYDDFSAYSDIWSLDPQKWSSPNSCSAIIDQKLQLNISGTVGRGDCALSFNNPALVDTVQADITLESVSSNDSHSCTNLWDLLF